MFVLSNLSILFFKFRKLIKIQFVGPSNVKKLSNKLNYLHNKWSVVNTNKNFKIIFLFNL